jgi:hypothetical protein
MDIDKNFANVYEKLDSILHLLKENKTDTDSRIDKLQRESTQRCVDHKAELTKKFKELDADVETINYFTKHPQVLKIVGIIILFLGGIALGHSNILDLIKIVK